MFLYHSLHELYEIGKTFVQEKDIESFVKSETFQTEVAKQYNVSGSLKSGYFRIVCIYSKVDLVNNTAWKINFHDEGAIVAEC